jgi:hypothetical protein
MTHRAAAALTVQLLSAHDALTRRLVPERGQGTVEYVALILLVAGVLAGVVAASGSLDGNKIGKTIVNKLQGALDGMKDAPSGH